MHASRFGLDADVVAACGSRVWAATTDGRIRAVHGTQPCPQRQAPHEMGASAAQCADCVELWTLTMLAAAQVKSRLTNNIIGDKFKDAERTWNSRYRGMTTRPRRDLYTTEWASKLIPDPVDRELLLGVIWYLRGATDPEGPAFPYQRLAGRESRQQMAEQLTQWAGGSWHAEDLLASPDEIARRLDRVLTRIWEEGNERRRRWLHRNVYRPLSERFAAHHSSAVGAGGDGSPSPASEELGQVASTNEAAGQRHGGRRASGGGVAVAVGAAEVASPDAQVLAALDERLVEEVIAQARTRTAQGEYADEAVRGELERRLGRAQARQLRTSAHWSWLVQQVEAEESESEPG
jgi:hypothetical protein